MAVNLNKALCFDFVLRDNGAVVAMGKASSVMLSEIATAFAFGIGGYSDPTRNNFIRGGWITLDMFLDMPPLTSDCWQMLSVDNRIYDFWCQRIEQ
jgi:hypothetical protein